LQPERFVNLGIEPPKGVLLFGPPGTGKTLCARAVANRTDACFIRVIGSELVQKYVGEVRETIYFILLVRSTLICSHDSHTSFFALLRDKLYDIFCET
jgi:ATP-dependent 26S proteasome regulatory subunit